MRPVVLIAVLASGCLSQDASLDEFADLQVAVNIKDGVASVTLFNVCRTLDASLTGSLDGVPAANIDRGRSDPSCHDPSMSFPPRDPVGDATIVIRDDSMAVTGTLPADAFALRRMTLVPDGPWVFTRGQTVVVHWEPPSDLAGPNPSVSLGLATTLPASVGTDGNITFTVPPMADVGTSQLAIGFTFTGTFCSSDHRCTVHVVRAAHASVTIQ